jgi:hypothetical protein
MLTEEFAACRHGVRVGFHGIMPVDSLLGSLCQFGVDRAVVLRGIRLRRCNTNSQKHNDRGSGRLAGSDEPGNAHFQVYEARW